MSIHARYATQFQYGAGEVHAEPVPDQTLVGVAEPGGVRQSHGREPGRVAPAHAPHVADRRGSHDRLAERGVEIVPHGRSPGAGLVFGPTAQELGERPGGRHRDGHGHAHAPEDRMPHEPERPVRVRAGRVEEAFVCF